MQHHGQSENEDSFQDPAHRFPVIHPVKHPTKYGENRSCHSGSPRRQRHFAMPVHPLGHLYHYKGDEHCHRVFRGLGDRQKEHHAKIQKKGKRRPPLILQIHRRKIRRNDRIASGKRHPAYQHSNEISNDLFCFQSFHFIQPSLISLRSSKARAIIKRHV